MQRCESSDIISVSLHAAYLKNGSANSKLSRFFDSIVEPHDLQHTSDIFRLRLVLHQNQKNITSDTTTAGSNSLSTSTSSSNSIRTRSSTSVSISDKPDIECSLELRALQVVYNQEFMKSIDEFRALPEEIVFKGWQQLQVSIFFIFYLFFNFFYLFF